MPLFVYVQAWDSNVNGPTLDTFKESIHMLLDGHIKFQQDHQIYKETKVMVWLHDFLMSYDVYIISLIGLAHLSSMK